MERKSMSWVANRRGVNTAFHDLFCGIKTLYAANLSFTNPFNTWDCYYVKSNVNLVKHTKLLLLKKECNVVLYSSKREEITLPHKFILCLPRTSLGRYCCQRWGVWKKYKVGMAIYESCLKKGDSNLLHTTVQLVKR